jgi:uncharacterized membrane protein
MWSTKFMSCYPKAISAFALILTAVGIVYPIIVYIGLHYLPPVAVVSILFLPLALKFFVDRRAPPRRAFAYVSLLALCIGAILIAVSPIAGLKSYPILVSLGLGSVFAYSLLYPPTIVERIARLQRGRAGPPPPISYLRKVTIAWLAFFVVNASVSLWTATETSMEVWTLYNGLISYLLIGLLFGGELIIRWRLQSRQSGAP